MEGSGWGQLKGRLLFQHLSGETEKNHEEPQDSRSQDRDFNPGPLEY
jgi:hypothetical protein